MESPHPLPDTRVRTRVTDCQLRWCCDPDGLGFESTREVPPIQGIVGQDAAIEALAFGLETDAPGMNVYVRGLTGTGRMKLVRRLLEEVQPACALAHDRCYVHNFDEADRPALIELPRGRGKAFRERIEELIEYVRAQLLPALSADAMKARRQELEQRLQRELQAIGQPFEEELTRNGLALVMVQAPGGAQPAIIPLVEGEPAPPERMQKLIAEGRLASDQLDALREKVQEFGQRLEDLNDHIHAARDGHRARMRELIEGEARRLLEFSVKEILTAFHTSAVERFLRGIVEDVIGRQLGALGEGKDPTELYHVNVILGHAADDPCPILVETQPSLANLVGVIDRQVIPGGGVYSDHTMIRAGSILAADGGYLVLEAREVLAEPGAWRVLMRTLRTGKLEITGLDSLLFGSTSSLKPEAIPINVKVVLIGEPGLYYLLDTHDADFPHLFKVLVDFDSDVPRNPESLRYYAGVLARMVAEESLLHYSAAAVAALAEHGARIAGRNDRLSTRFGRLADLAREASFLARKQGRALVEAADVKEAVRRTRRRADLPARRFRRAIAEGTIRIATSGYEVGQVNGLAVTHAGPLTYGFPARITATIGPGHAGTIDIEAASQLSGSIHTKGFQILGGLLRHLMRPAAHPLAFSASIAFEQSYGGIDGDSASGAEMCCLLSALTGVPLSQSIAMTGAIDQHGHLQPVGAVSEKIEGFFDVCSDAGLSGEQGVIVPYANRFDLVLREDVVAACEAQRFHVWAVSAIGEALEVLTGWRSGDLDAAGAYPEGTLLALAVERASEFWRLASATPPGPKRAEEDSPQDEERAAAARR